MVRYAHYPVLNEIPLSSYVPAHRHSKGPGIASREPARTVPFPKAHAQARLARELLLRVDAQTDQSGAFLLPLLRAIPTIVSGISSLFGGDKRDIEEMVARELARRAEEDQSGAFLLPLLRALPAVVSGISNLFGGGNKRELVELELASRELVARAETDESGAFLLPLLRAIPAVVSGLSNLFGGNKRDRKSTRLNSSHSGESRMPSSA